MKRYWKKEVEGSYGAPLYIRKLRYFGHIIRKEDDN